MASSSTISTARAAAPTRGRKRSPLWLAVGLVAALATVASVRQPAAAETTAFPTVDGQFQGTGLFSPGSVLDLTVVGRGGVPATGVDAVVVNVTATNPTAASYLTVFPTGTTRPTTSNLNFLAGQTTPNLVVAKIGTGGKISIFNQSGATDVIVDVMGWFPTGGGFTSLAPARLLETRAGLPTIDGLNAGGGQLGTAGVLDLTVVGRGGVPATGVDAVVVNVTATNPTAASYLTVFPTGTTRPTTSNLNFLAGQTTPNLVVAKIGTGGKISIFNQSGATDVIVDVMGWFPTGGGFTSLAPARLLETRAGLPTIDGLNAGGGQLGTAGVLDLTVVGRGGVPATGVDAVVVNVTATNPTAASYLTVFPTGTTRPTTSNLNFLAGQTTPNLVVAKIGTGGKISIFNQSGATDVIVDVMGWFPTGGGFTSLAPARLLETRGRPTASSPAPTAPTTTTTAGTGPTPTTAPVVTLPPSTGGGKVVSQVLGGGFFFGNGSLAATWTVTDVCEIANNKVHMWFTLRYTDGTESTEGYWYDIITSYVETLTVDGVSAPLSPAVFLDLGSGQCIPYTAA